MLKDRELVERCLAGEVDAFHGLVERYRDSLYRLVYRFLGNHDDALEVSQESFARAYEKLESFDRKRSFRVWLLSVAGNCARDLLRKNKRRGLVVDHERVRSVSGGRSPTAQVSEKEEHERLRAAVAELSDEKRMVVVLRYFEGMSLAEIEEITGEPRNTLKVRLFRARKELFAKLDGKRHET